MRPSHTTGKLRHNTPDPSQSRGIVARYVSRFNVSMAVTLSIVTLGEILLAKHVHLSGMAQLLGAWPGTMLLVGCLYYCKQRPMPRLREPCEMTIWAVLSSNVLAFMIQLAARSPFPLVDVQLAALDRSMHFETAAIAQFVARLPLLETGLALAYVAIPVLVFAAILIPPFYGQVKASQRYVMAVVVATVFTSILFSIWPACGPWMTENLRPTQEQAAVTTRLLLLKSHSPAIIDLDHNALVSFPSFHIVLAMLSAMALNKLPRVRIAAWGLAIPTCISTITTGWHYGIDVLGGLTVAAAAWCVVSLAVTVESAEEVPARLRGPLSEVAEDRAA